MAAGVLILLDYVSGYTFVQCIFLQSWMLTTSQEQPTFSLALSVNPDKGLELLYENDKSNLSTYIRGAENAVLIHAHTH